MLPAALEDYVGADNPVRFLDVFIAKLNTGGVPLSWLLSEGFLVRGKIKVGAEVSLAHWGYNLKCALLRPHLYSNHGFAGPFAEAVGL